MGLAASQARFLGLTARKSNVEYKGQQINQQRVALSNEVMGLYNEYNNLDVPIPPSVNDYQKTLYTLDSTFQDYKIENFSKITDGPYAGYYDVLLSYTDEVPRVYAYAAKDSVITAKKEGDEYSYLKFQLGVDSFYYDKDDENCSITKITGDYDKYQGLADIMASQGKTDGTYYMFVKDNTAYYTSEDDLNSTAFDTVDDKQMYYGTYTFDYEGSQKTDKHVSAKAAFTQESSGRLSSIHVIECEDDPSLVDNAYSITTERVDDQDAYKDAMNEYAYKKELYEREVERINEKTEIIQKEDRSLELQLNQLDTEQKAIATEMDSVSKVIQDTVESVFKTFQS